MKNILLNILDEDNQLDDNLRDFLTQQGLFNEQKNISISSNIDGCSPMSKTKKNISVLNDLSQIQQKNSFCHQKTNSNTKNNCTLIKADKEPFSKSKKQQQIKKIYQKNVNKPSNLKLNFEKQKYTEIPIPAPSLKYSLSNKIKVSQNSHKNTNISNQFPFNYSISQLAQLPINPKKKQNITEENNKDQNIEKKSQQFHKRIQIFDQSCYIRKENVNQTKQIPTLALPITHIHMNLGNYVNKVKETKIKQNILFFDTFNLKQQKQQSQNKIKNPSKFNNNNSSHSYTTSTQNNNNYENVQYIICQKSNFTTYLSYINLKSEYKILRKITLNSKICTMIYIKSKINQSMVLLGNNVQNRLNLNISQSKQLGVLYLGCQNGFIYVIKVTQQLINGQNNLQLSQNNIIQVTPNSQRQQNNQITNILAHSNKNLIYVILNNNQIKIYQKQQIKIPLSKKSSPNISNQQYIQKYNQFQSKIKVKTQHKLKILKYIKIYHQDENKYEKVLLIWTDKLHAPCILTEQQFNIWFPCKLDKLIQTFNSIWDSQHFDKPYSEEKMKQHEILYMKNIVCIDYQPRFNRLVIGCNNGNVYFGNIECTLQKTKKNINETVNFLSLLEVSQLCEKQNNAQAEQSSENDQNKKFISNIFNFKFVPQFIIQESASIRSLTLLQNQPYICISTSTKIIFYDIQNRNKFSGNLKQKQNSIVNCVKWTMNQKLLLCSIGEGSAKIYLYFNELPIRRTNPQKLKYNI